MNYCARSGFLVGPQYSIPSDATEVGVEGLPAIGCNRLRCARCGVAVRNTIDPPLPARRYFCRCSHWSEADLQALEDDDAESFRSSPAVAWRCQGHPPIGLPHDIDGAVVRSQAELIALTSCAMEGALPPRARPGDAKHGTWLHRLHARLSGEDAAAVANVVVESLAAPDAGVRARALHFFVGIAHEPARIRLVALLAGQRALFAGSEEATAWRVLAPMVAEEGPARELARAEALGGRGCGALFDALAAGDTEWFLLNSRQMAGANAARDRVRATIAEMSTLEQAFAATSCPLVTWDCNEIYFVRLRLFATSDSGAMLMKAGDVEPKELELWNERARGRGGRVGGSHTHAEVVWLFEDDDCGIWTKSRRVVRGDRHRLLLQGSYVATCEIARITSFINATPEAVHRGVRCTLNSGREILIHEEHDDDPPSDPDYSGEAVAWESEWVWNLSGDLATFLGVPCTDRHGAISNSRELEVRAAVMAFADSLAGIDPCAPACCEFTSYDREDLRLQWAPEGGVLTLSLRREERTWEWEVKRGTATDIVAYLRHFLTPRRLLRRARGGY